MKSLIFAASALFMVGAVPRAANAQAQQGTSGDVAIYVTGDARYVVGVLPALPDGSVRFPGATCAVSPRCCLLVSPGEYHLQYRSPTGGSGVTDIHASSDSSLEVVLTQRRRAVPAGPLLAVGSIFAIAGTALLIAGAARTSSGSGIFGGLDFTSGILISTGLIGFGVSLAFAIPGFILMPDPPIGVAIATHPISPTVEAIH